MPAACYTGLAGFIGQDAPRASVSSLKKRVSPGSASVSASGIVISLCAGSPKAPVMTIASSSVPAKVYQVLFRAANCHGRVVSEFQISGSQGKPFQRPPPNFKVTLVLQCLHVARNAAAPRVFTIPSYSFSVRLPHASQIKMK